MNLALGKSSNFQPLIPQKNNPESCKYTTLSVFLPKYKTITKWKSHRKQPFLCQNYFMDIDASSFWRRVNSLIKARKTKQEAIAKECNIPYPTFRGMVTRKTFPGGDETYRIAQALGTTVEYLITGENPKSASSDEAFDEIQSIIDKYRSNPKKT